MKMLFWKEWHELRALPLGAAVAVAVLMTCVKVLTRGSHDPFLAETAFILVGVWLLFGAVAGASAITQEIGSGTLQFLSSLPISRGTIWWVKSSAALGMLLPTVLSSSIVWALFHMLWAPPGARSLNDFLGVLAFFLPCLLGVFVVALAVSPFFDRTMSAVIVAVLAAIGIASLFINIVSKYSGGIDGPLPMLFTLVGLSIPTFAAISYWTFTRGEALRDGRRFKAAGAAAGICLAIDAIIVLTAGAAGAW